MIALDDLRATKAARLAARLNIHRSILQLDVLGLHAGHLVLVVVGGVQWSVVVALRGAARRPVGHLNHDHQGDQQTDADDHQQGDHAVRDRRYVGPLQVGRMPETDRLLFAFDADRFLIDVVSELSVEEEFGRRKEWKEKSEFEVEKSLEGNAER